MPLSTPLLIPLTLFLLLSSPACGKQSGTRSPLPESDVDSLRRFSPVAPARSNPMAVYAHYMPWFEDKETSGNGTWGMHWTMSTRNPDVIDADGRREIAAHFHPLIGPYASSDPDLLEYHSLLMKLSGINGALVDWYGTHDVYDYRPNKRNTEALMDQLEKVGLQFAVVYEDNTAEKVAQRRQAQSPIEAAHADLLHLQQHYFSRPSYIAMDGAPLLLTFGPKFFETEEEWTRIFADIVPKPRFLPLWHQSSDAGVHASGEFAWVYSRHLEGLDDFYRNAVPQLATSIGAAYPGFQDYYRGGGWGDGLGWKIDHHQGATFAATLEKARQADLDALQLVTWNDFGEGTMIEPTLEFGFTFLEQVQRFTGVAYTRRDLKRVHRLYQLRKKYPHNDAIQRRLDQIFYYFISLHTDEAANLLDGID